MRRSELLEKQSRRASENERVGSSDGISSEEVYQYFTDGLRFLQRKILLAGGTPFRGSFTWSATGAESYALPFDLFTQNNIVALFYSDSGNAEDYRPLDRIVERERLFGDGCPGRYLIEDGYVYVSRYPRFGSFLMIYDKLRPSIDKRRATVASSTTAGGALTALTLAGYTAADYALSDHLTIVDFNGVVKMRGIPYTAVNAGSGVVSILGGSYTYPVGSTIAVNDFVCLGSYASTHPQIDDCFEDFFVTYGQRRLLKRDSTADAEDIAEELSAMWQDGVAVYAMDSDISQVPMPSHDFFSEFF